MQNIDRSEAYIYNEYDIETTPRRHKLVLFAGITSINTCGADPHIRNQQHKLLPENMDLKGVFLWPINKHHNILHTSWLTSPRNGTDRI